MDGVSVWQMWWRSACRWPSPRCSRFAVLQFIQIWNDCWSALCSCRTSNERTVTVASRCCLGQGHERADPDGGSVMSVIPPIIVYLLFQKHLVRGITLGVGK